MKKDKTVKKDTIASFTKKLEAVVTDIRNIKREMGIANRNRDVRYYHRRCPVCNNDDLQFDVKDLENVPKSLESEKFGYRVKVHCNGADCNGSWDEVHIIARIENITK